MTTESPLISIGSQCTAAADLSGATTSLAGPNNSGQFLAVKLTASRQVNLANTGGEAVLGILQNTPAQGQAADIGFVGVSKAVVGAAVAAGGRADDRHQRAADHGHLDKPSCRAGARGRHGRRPDHLRRDRRRDLQPRVHLTNPQAGALPNNATSRDVASL